MLSCSASMRRDASAYDVAAITHCSQFRPGSGSNWLSGGGTGRGSSVGLSRCVTVGQSSSGATPSGRIFAEASTFG